LYCLDNVFPAITTHLVSHQVCGVEADTELADHGHISTSGQGLHEGLGAGAGNGAQVVDQVSL
jgi:hypothetical protein